MTPTTKLFEAVRASKRFKELSGDSLKGAEFYLSGFEEVVEENHGENNSHLLDAAIEYFAIGGRTLPQGITKANVAFANGGDAAHGVMIELINVVWPNSR